MLRLCALWCGALSVIPIMDTQCSASASDSAFKACRARVPLSAVSTWGLDFHIWAYYYEPVTERVTVLGRTEALQSFPEYWACFHTPISSWPDLLPSLPLLSPSSPPSPPSPQSLLWVLSRARASPGPSRLRVTGFYAIRGLIRSERSAIKT